jgi:hypothetical protein
MVAEVERDSAVSGSCPMFGGAGAAVGVRRDERVRRDAGVSL